MSDPRGRPGVRRAVLITRVLSVLIGGGFLALGGWLIWLSTGH